MQEVNQQAYDRGSTIFSPDGRLYQVEYAREAVERGTAAVGVRTDEGVVLAVDKRVRSPLMERDSVEKLHAIDDHLGVASAGHVADGRRLVDFLRRDAQRDRVRYGEPVDTRTATRRVSDLVQAYTQFGGARPFGAAVLIAGVDPDGTARLYETDPSGTVDGWQAVAVGAHSEDVQAFLEETYEDGMTLDGGVSLALRAISVPKETPPNAAEVAVATVDVASGTVDVLDDAAVADHVDDVADAADDAGDGDGSGGDSDGA